MLADSSVSVPGKNGFTENDMANLLGGLLEADMAYSLRNAVRRSMMIKCVCRPDFTLLISWTVDEPSPLHGKRGSKARKAEIPRERGPPPTKEERGHSGGPGA